MQLFTHYLWFCVSHQPIFCSFTVMLAEEYSCELRQWQARMGKLEFDTIEEKERKLKELEVHAVLPFGFVVLCCAVVCCVVL